MQGYYVLSSKRMSANSNNAGETVLNIALAKPSQPKHEQVSVGVPAVSLRSCGFRGAVRAVFAASIEVQHLLRLLSLGSFNSTALACIGQIDCH